MYTIFFVLDDPDKLREVLDALEKVGISGVTILESTGLNRVKRKAFPMRYLPDFYNQEENHLTLMTIVKEEAMIEACLQATESVVGELSNPNTGIFAAWPISFAKGGSLKVGD